MTITYFDSQEDMDDAFEKHMELLQDIEFQKELIDIKQGDMDDLWEQHKEAIQDMNFLVEQLQQLEKELREYE